VRVHCKKVAELEFPLQIVAGRNHSRRNSPVEKFGKGLEKFNLQIESHLQGVRNYIRVRFCSWC